MNYSIRCTCGALQGTLEQPAALNRCVCYCRDCQAFAHFLKRSADILDTHGGTEILQILPKYLHFSTGTENLACMRLSDKGTLRWYSLCCNTPIGNTLINYKISFIGLIHNFIALPEAARTQSFGPIRMHVHTQGAQGAIKPKPVGVGAGAFRFGKMILGARFNGDYKITPFFDVKTGLPVALPKILNAREHEEVMRAVK